LLDNCRFNQADERLDLFQFRLGFFVSLLQFADRLIRRKVMAVAAYAGHDRLRRRRRRPEGQGRQRDADHDGSFARCGQKTCESNNAYGKWTQKN
jgi:hypothetical protein